MTMWRIRMLNIFPLGEIRVLRFANLCGTVPNTITAAPSDLSLPA
jgi:hypothetical protein